MTDRPDALTDGLAAASHAPGAATPAPPEAAERQDWDPLASLRSPSDPPLDVLLSGTVFFDIVFTGLDRLPQPGEELWSKGMGSSPGGIANLATAAARLGLRTGLVAGFGDDAYGEWMWQTLSEEEGIDLSASRRFDDFHSALTVSIAAHGDRAMATHGHDLPEPLSAMIARAPAARAAVVDLAGETSWWAELARGGALIFADIGFDATGKWDPADLAPLAAGMVLGTLAEWPLEQRLRFASLCSALAVQQFGGSLAAPGWGDITDWWRQLSDASAGGDLRAAYTRGGYEFLDGIVPDHPVLGRRRAQGTFALRSDAGRH